MNKIERNAMLISFALILISIIVFVIASILTDITQPYIDNEIKLSLEPIKYELNPIMYNDSISINDKFIKIQIECNKNKDMQTQYCVELLTQYYSNELDDNK